MEKQTESKEKECSCYHTALWVLIIILVFLVGGILGYLKGSYCGYKKACFKDFGRHAYKKVLKGHHGPMAPAPPSEKKK